MTGEVTVGDGCVVRLAETVGFEIGNLSTDSSGGHYIKNTLVRQRRSGRSSLYPHTAGCALTPRGVAASTMVRQAPFYDVAGQGKLRAGSLASSITVWFFLWGMMITIEVSIRPRGGMLELSVVIDDRHFDQRF